MLLQAKRNKDVGMGLKDFLSLDGNLLVPFLFHEVTSLYFREKRFSTCPIHFFQLEAKLQYKYMIVFVQDRPYKHWLLFL